MGKTVYIRHNVYLNNKVTSGVVLPFMVRETLNVLQPSLLSYVANLTQHFVFMPGFPYDLSF